MNMKFLERFSYCIYINKTLKEFNSNITLVKEDRNIINERPIIKQQMEVAEKRKVWQPSVLPKL